MQNINFVEGSIGTVQELGLGNSPADAHLLQAQRNCAKIVFPQGWYLTIHDNTNVLKFMEKNPEHPISQHSKLMLHGRSKKWLSKNPYEVSITTCHYRVTQELSKSWNSSHPGLKKFQQFLPICKGSDDLGYASLNPQLLEEIINWLAAQPRHPKNDEGMENTRKSYPHNRYLPENWVAPEFQHYQA